MSSPILPGLEQPTTATKPMPDWLVQHIETTTGQAPGGRNAKASRCLQCKARVIRGYDSDWCAFSVLADPAPLTRTGEALALLTGRRTYDLVRVANRWQLTRRHHWRIAGSTSQIRADVLTEHRCGSPPAHITTTVHQITARKEEVRDAQQPPY